MAESPVQFPFLQSATTRSSTSQALISSAALQAPFHSAELWHQPPNPRPQAALQAPIHFAKLDAVQHSEIAEREGVKGFPTFKGYTGGRMVKQYSGARTVTGFMGFAKEVELLHY